MSVVSIDKAGRVIIPSDVRKKLGIKANTRLFLIDIGEKIVMEKLERLEITRRLQEELKGVDIDTIGAETEGKMIERAVKTSEEDIALERRTPRDSTKARLDKVRAVIRPILQDFSVKRASVFGSVVRDDFSNKSDIDLLVDLPEGSTLLDLIKLEDELKEKLGRKVDLVTFDSIHPALRQTIMAEQVPIFP